MPALQPIVLYKQGTVDPADARLEFEPLGVVNGLASFQGNLFHEDPANPGSVISVTNSAALQPIMTVSLQKPSKTSRITKSRVKIVIPQPVIDGVVPTKAKDREASIDITVMASERADQTEIFELVMFGLAALNYEDIQLVTQEGKSYY